MSERPDWPTQPSPQQPVKPPETEGAATPPTPPSPPKEVWLPPRLRDRLEQKQYDEPDYKKSPVGMIVTIVVIIAVICGVVWLVMMNKAKEQKAVLAAKVEAARVAAH